MVERFQDGFDGALDDVHSTSDKALYEYLRVHICGPYVNDCHPYLSEIKYRLHDEGFDQAKLCTDRPETTPDHLDKDELTDEELQELREFWTSVSKEFLKNADVAVFFFLDPTPVRDELPERAFDDKNDPSVDHTQGQHQLSQDPNISVMVELNYWLSELGLDPSRSLVLFEQSNYEETGGLASGDIEQRGIHWDTINTDDVDDAFDVVRPKCVNWAMNECKPRLQDRYYQDL